LFLPPWDQHMMSSGPAVYAKRYLQELGSVPLTDILRKRGEILFYRDGISSTVAVFRRGQNVFLTVNGKTDASTTVAMPTQLMLGHLPLLVHQDPRTALVVGLGSGATAGAVAAGYFTLPKFNQRIPAIAALAGEPQGRRKRQRHGAAGSARNRG